LDAEDFQEIQKKIGQPLDAMAAHIVSDEEDLARELAEGLSHEELITLVLFLGRLYAFGFVDSYQRTHGVQAEEAKKFAADQFRKFAAAKSLGFDDSQ
jgi:hypothetical protein